MLNREAEEVLADILVKRIDDANKQILQTIGESLKMFNKLNPSQAFQLAQILKYGGSYEQIAKTLAKISKRNVSDIYKIFKRTARDNKDFAKQFYQYRGIDFIPYEQDVALQNQVNALARITNNTYQNIANSSVVGYLFEDQYGRMQFKNLRDTYYQLIDKAVMNVSQGKQTFDEELKQTLKQIGGSGLVTYESGRTRRLDSAVRMNLQDSIRSFKQALTQQYGAEYQSDGVEISVHEHPAPDHEDIQGRQFTNVEYNKLQNQQKAKDLKGNVYNGAEKRRIAQYNCYHTIFNIIVGVSKPRYTDRQLERIKEQNEKGFEYNGRHYTLYEGTQLQRRIETAIRKQRDEEILAKASGDTEWLEDVRYKIKKLKVEYNALNKASGLRPKEERTRLVRR